MATIYVFHDIQKAYLDFLENKHYPKLESLTNWGKNRFFFHLHFKMIEDWHVTEHIVIQFNHRTYRLNTALAPDFMDKERYIDWLHSELTVY